MNTTTKFSRRTLIGFVILAVVLTFMVTPMESHAASKKSSNAYAKSIKLYALDLLWDESGKRIKSESYERINPAFKKSKYSYTFTTDNSDRDDQYIFTERTLKIVPDNKKASVYLKTSEDDKYVKKNSVRFRIYDGKTEDFWFQIHSQDGKNKRTYKVAVKRKETKASKIVKKVCNEKIRPLNLDKAHQAYEAYKWLRANVEIGRRDDWPINGYDDGAILYGAGECSEFANAYCRFMSELGIPNRYIRGTLMGAWHAWSIVKIGSNWYHVDVLNGRFLRSDEYMVRTGFTKPWNYTASEPEFMGHGNFITQKCPKNYRPYFDEKSPQKGRDI
jgi:transglutaminase/protease-like cytokinesis protein 3